MSVKAYEGEECRTKTALPEAWRREVPWQMRIWTFGAAAQSGQQNTETAASPMPLGSFVGQEIENPSLPKTVSTTDGYKIVTTAQNERARSGAT